MFNLCCCHGQQDLFPVATAPFDVIGSKAREIAGDDNHNEVLFTVKGEKLLILVLLDPLLPVKYNINRLLDFMLSKEQKTIDISLSICNFFKWHP